MFLKISQNWQVFPCEFCETFEDTFFIEHLRKTADVGMENI